MTVEGIDVSNWQGLIDWPRALKDPRVGFVIAKASEGINFVDAYLAHNASGVRAGQRPFGVYHYGRPSINAPEDEAAHHLRQLDSIGGLQPGELSWLDMEDPDVPTGTSVAEWSLRWLTKVEAVIGKPPGFYTYPYYTLEHDLRHATELGRFPLWWASYDLDTYPVPPAWQGFALHQFTTSWRVAGMAGDIDGNQLPGPLADFVALGLAGPHDPLVPNPNPLTGVWIHEYFVPTWTPDVYGLPLMGAALYSDGIVRQLFENGVWRASPREQARPERGVGQALFHMTGGQLPDWSQVHPLT